MRTAGPLLGTALLLLTSGAATAETVTVDRPQTLQYRLAWNGLPAARATISVHSDDLAEPTAYTVDARAKTNSFVDFFYRFRGRAHVTFLAARKIPLHFRYERDVRGVPYDTTVTFDPTAQRVRSRYIKRGELRKQLSLPSDGLFDPITAVFHARHAPDDVGTSRTYEVFTGESRYRVQLTVRGHETIEVPAGSFPAIRVEPQIWKIYGDERPPEDRLSGTTIWVSDDRDRVLLRISTDMLFGAITLDLVSREIPS